MIKNKKNGGYFGKILIFKICQNIDNNMTVLYVCGVVYVWLILSFVFLGKFGFCLGKSNFGKITELDWKKIRFLNIDFAKVQ